MPIYIDCAQRSDEWHALRRGVITASACEFIMTPAQRKGFINKTIAELLTGQSEPFIMNEYIQWGVDKEEEARIAYIAKTGIQVKETGFVFMDDDKRVGCSPDGLVGNNGLIEIKCPATRTHVGYLQDGPPRKYMMQMQFQMMVTDRDWCDFITFDPRIGNENIKINVTRIERDEDLIHKIKSSVNATIRAIDEFLEEHNITLENK